MKHYGDITKINGAEVPVVDIITGGSPCQDLSVAGKRAGLAGERSGLFMEQMRIVKEMREQDVRSGRNFAYARPRYMVWENVPGAFSSGKPKGADFAAVIEEIVKVAEPGAAVSVCVPNGGWTKSGCYYAKDGSWSIAWRVHDAQFWGVPQRRKRIALVADFGGLSAPEILFERKGLSGNSEQSAETREGVAAEAESGAGGTGGEVAATITATYGTKWNGNAGAYNGQNFVIEGADIVPSILQTSGVVSKGNGEAFLMPEKTSSLAVGGGMPGQGYPCVLQNAEPQAVYCLQGNGIDRADTAGCNGKGWREDQCYTLNTIDRPAVMAYGISSYDSNAMKSPNPHSGIYEADTARTLDLNGGSPACNQGGIAVVQSAVYDARGNGDGKTVCTITGDHENSVTDYTALCVGNGQANQSVSDKDGALNTMHDQQELCPTIKAAGGMGGGHTPMVVQQPNLQPTTIYGKTVTPTLISSLSTPVGNTQDGLCVADTALCMDVGFFQTHEERAGTLLARQYKDPPITSKSSGCIVRRLTPLECERLQGFPDGWTDIGEWVDSKGKKHGEADSPRYKALGNSIALPFWQWMARRICAQYERPVTMASLFDGIGGFPLVFQRCGAVPVWASEIEEFPIAVTKVRFPDESV